MTYLAILDGDLVDGGFLLLLVVQKVLLSSLTRGGHDVWRRWCLRSRKLQRQKRGTTRSRTMSVVEGMPTAGGSHGGLGRHADGGGSGGISVAPGLLSKSSHCSFNATRRRTLNQDTETPGLHKVAVPHAATKYREQQWRQHRTWWLSALVCACCRCALLSEKRE